MAGQMLPAATPVHLHDATPIVALHNPAVSTQCAPYETVAQPVLVCRCLGATNVAAEWRFWGVLSRVLPCWHDAFTKRDVQVICG